MKKKFDKSLRKTGSSWEKMSIPNLSVPLLCMVFCADILDLSKNDLYLLISHSFWLALMGMY